MKLSNPTKYLIIVAWCSIGFITGLLVFARGLLLHRDVLPNKSSCVKLNESCREVRTFTALEQCLSSYSSDDAGEQLCKPSEFRIVLIIVDALRYDFVEYSDLSSNQPFYANKLVLVRDLLENYPNQSRLFKFIADPPTTTMQRILGLTTGSLPTFVDVGSNFASSEINEDNIVDSLNRRGKNAVFLGDDTWSKLYPNRFIRSYPFDSFNVWDLDTVDSGIRKHLFPELRKRDWHLMIAHFLGVDHCGHRYGPDHPEMERKLEEINEVLKNIVDEIKKSKDTLLLVIGDHGMTSTGDHGGDTENEITTALFIHSPVYDLYGGSSSSRNQIIRQVDMAPTLSSILGLPIPFSSVGSVILDCFPVSLVVTSSEAIFQLWRNVEQITNYVVEYSSHNAQLKATKKVDFILAHYQKLKSVRANLRSDLAQFLLEYRAYMTNISAMCREVWVQFDVTSIGCGLGILLVMTILSFCICEKVTLHEVRTCLHTNTFLFAGKIVCSLPIVIYAVSWALGTSAEFTAFMAIAVMCIGVVGWQCRRLCKGENVIWELSQRLTFFNAFVTLVVLVSLCGLFSNSFIIEEPSVILFIIFTLMWLRFLLYRPPKITIWKQITLLQCMMCVLVGARVSLEFVRCHEEQAQCKDIVTKKYETHLCVASMTILGLCIGRWLMTSALKVSKFLAVLCTSLIIVYWTCETFFEHFTYCHSIPALLLPLIISSISYFLVWPAVPMEFTEWPSWFEVPFANISIFFGLLGCVILKQTYAVSVLLMVVSIRSLAVFLGICCESAGKYRRRFEVPWSNVILWAMSSIYWFYATGHYASFSGIQWNAAFLLQKEIGNDMLIPGILVVLNTFFSYLVHAITLPMLLIAPWTTSQRVLPVEAVRRKIADENQPNSNVLQLFYHGIFVLCMKYLTFFGLRLFFVTLSTTILSRHLMMWKIFAPKFIFEAIAFIAVTVPAVLLGFAYVFNIGRTISQAQSSLVPD